MGGLSQSVRAVVVSPAMVQQRASDLVKSGERVLVLRARPEWNGGDVKVGDHSVRVIPAVSQLAILDAYTSLGPDDYAVILTDRPAKDLGEAVLARAYKQQVEMPDEWQAVPRLFQGAREVSRELRRLDWAATALLDHQPVGGWPRSPDVAVTDRHAIGSLLGQVTGLGATVELDGAVLLAALGRRDLRSTWAAVDESLRRHLTAWAGNEYGAPAAFALKVAQRQEHVTPLAVGLALDVLWPEDGSTPDAEQVAARVRVERLVDGRTVSVEEAKAVARVAKATVLRVGAEDSPEVAIALQQAEALLGDLEWPAGAERSTVLRPGYRARVRRLAEALTSDAGVEDALVAVHEHRLGRTSPAPEMAVRLHRWLTVPEAAFVGLADDLQTQMVDGAWVDAALGALWSGSDDPVVSDAYRTLAGKARKRRHSRDEVAAGRLSSALTVGPRARLSEAPIGVERILSDVVGPWRKGGALLVVLDGLSSAIATSLAGEVARAGLVEHVPDASAKRVGAVAVLPSLTSISRASLFCGEVREGGADDEKKGLATAFPGSVVFHKNDLRAKSGEALPAVVAEAVNNPKVPVVGVVINAIDDAVHKNDTSALSWSVDQLTPLRALLDTAVATRRTVIITSDHGHVVERDTEALSMPGADARWRSGGVAPRAGEVEVSGPRVVAPDGSAILLWREDAHFGPRRAGYHGGASLAEITVPVLVFQPATALAEIPSGWMQAPPQVPTWWNEPLVSPAAAPILAGETVKKKRKPSRPVINDEDALFSVDIPAAAPAASSRSDVVDALLASKAYADQRAMAGRRALPDADVAAFLRVLLEREGRAHKDTVAAAARIAAPEVGKVFAAVKRLINVEGFEVLRLDSDGVTYRIDEALLREQFELGGR
ncbi:BREX-2 system phosphatase PglZ [Nocardioides sp. NPDC057767]|uniref:BREX-2 system phosphatase PglZ n=1 Tax=unclassified Nocardioides TaxID=2615069 RepID=UPI00367169C1